MNKKITEKYLKQVIDQPKWQRIILLCVLGYETAGAFSGGILLTLAPDGRLMDMPVEIMHGFFKDFLVPGFILIGLGILNAAAFITVLLRKHNGWFFSCLALGGLFIWFTTEIIIIQDLHWLHAMWGLPVVLGCLMVFSLIPNKHKTKIRQ